LDDERLYQAHADICKTFANPWRLRIVDSLGTGEVTVSELSERLGISTPLVSQHLAVMRDKGVVEARRAGTRMYYRLSNSKTLVACRLMREVLLEHVEKASGLLRAPERDAGPA
jgi:ArsR family transcriptional regulator